MKKLSIKRIASMLKYSTMPGVNTIINLEENKYTITFKNEEYICTFGDYLNKKTTEKKFKKIDDLINFIHINN